MEYEKSVGSNKVFVSETSDSLLVFDRNTGEIHYSKNPESLDGILANIGLKPEKKSVFVKTDENVFKLNLSTICNLNCDYCFRDKGSHVKTDVTKAKKIIDFIIDDYMPHAWMYSFSVNLTSESLVELDRIREIKRYIDERTRPGFSKKDFKNLDGARRYLACFPAALYDNYKFEQNGEKEFDEIIKLLDSFLDRKDLVDFFPFPDGMILPAWEGERYKNLEKLNSMELREFNLRFLEALFPETILRKPHYSFYICTNGTVFNDDVVDFFKEIKLESVCVSLDGPSGIHNLHRFFNNNEASHGIIVENIKKFMAAGLKVNIAAVLTADYPYPLQLVEYFKNLGVSSVEMTVVRAGFPGSFNENSIEKLLKGYEILFQRLFEDIQKGDYSLVNLLKDSAVFSGIKLLLTKNRIVKRCKWNENTIFDEEGDIYPCDYFIGKRKFLRGNINSTEVRDIYSEELLVDNRETCKDCWCKYLCGGTCYYNSLKNEANLLVPDAVECKFNKGLRVLSIKFIQKLLDSGFDLMELFGRFGFEMVDGILFDEKFYVKQGAIFSFRGTLTKLEMEIKKLYELFSKNKVKHDEQVFISVLDVTESNSNRILDVVVVVPVKNNLSKEILEGLDWKYVKNLDFGLCISGESENSSDEKVEEIKNKICEMVQAYKIPMNGNFWYRGNIDAFLGYKNQPIKVFMQRTKNVF